MSAPVVEEVRTSLPVEAVPLPDASFLQGVTLDAATVGSPGDWHVIAHDPTAGKYKAVDIDTIISGTYVDATGDTMTGDLTMAADILPDAASTRSLGASGTEWANVYADALYGTLQTAAQPNITSLGPLTGLSVTAGTVDVDVAADFASTVVIRDGGALGIESGGVAISTVDAEVFITGNGAEIRFGGAGGANQKLSFYSGGSQRAYVGMAGADQLDFRTVINDVIRFYTNNTLRVQISKTVAGFEFGSNADVNLYTPSANVLKTDDSLVVAGAAAKFSGISTTASAANAYLDAGDSNNLLRSTSSLRYKDVVADVTALEARDLVLALQPFWYRSLAEADDPDRIWPGLGAEHLDALGMLGQRFVSYDEKGRPDGVAYDRLTVPMALMLQDHEERIEDTRTELERLQDRVDVLETENERLREQVTALAN